jgi:hypothetical protein
MSLDLGVAVPFTGTVSSGVAVYFGLKLSRE